MSATSQHTRDMRIEQGSKTIADFGYDKYLSKGVLESGESPYLYRGDLASGDLDGLFPRPSIVWGNGYTTFDARYTLAGTTPGANNSTGTVGQLAYDSGYLYICVATDTWKRVAVVTWP